jgi:hypothetical protein
VVRPISFPTLGKGTPKPPNSSDTPVFHTRFARKVLKDFLDDPLGSFSMQQIKKIQPAAMVAATLIALSMLAGCTSAVVNRPPPPPRIIELTLINFGNLSTSLHAFSADSLTIGQWSVSKNGSFPGPLGVQITKSKFYLGVLASNNFVIRFDCPAFFQGSFSSATATLNRLVSMVVDKIPTDGKSYPCTVRVYYDIDRDYPILTQQVSFSATP